MFILYCTCIGVLYLGLLTVFYHCLSLSSERCQNVLYNIRQSEAKSAACVSTNDWLDTDCFRKYLLQLFIPARCHEFEYIKLYV